MSQCDYCLHDVPGELAPGPDAEARFVEEFHRFPTFYEWQALQKTQAGWDLAARCRDSDACLQRHRERFPPPPLDPIIVRARDRDAAIKAARDRRAGAEETAELFLTALEESLAPMLAPQRPAAVREMVRTVGQPPSPSPRLPAPQEPPQPSRPRRRPRPLVTSPLMVERARGSAAAVRSLRAERLTREPP